jgi:hypothetical protein
MVLDLASPQSLNRYSYVLNNPLRYTDPSGHWFETALDIAGILYDVCEIHRDGLNWKNGLALAVDVGCLLLPVATGGGMVVRAVTKADDAIDAVRAVDRIDDAADAMKVLDNVDDIVDAARAADAPSLRKLAKGNFRENLRRLTGRSADDIAGMEAHHVLPQELADEFGSRGVDIHDPQFGSWVETTAHRSWSSEYNRRWQKFMGTDPADGDILAFAKELSEEYGFDVHFELP